MNSSSLPTPVRHDPLDAFADRFAAVATASNGAVRLEAIPFLAQVDIHADASDPALLDQLGTALGIVLPLRPNTTSSAPGGARRVLWLGPDEWLIVDADGTADAIVAAVRGALEGARGSVVDVSANRTTLRLAGPAAREILETGCSIDLHPRAFAPGVCAQTTIARTSAILLEVDAPPDAAGGPDYRLLVRPSFAGYLASWLLDAVDGLGDEVFSRPHAR